MNLCRNHKQLEVVGEQSLSRAAGDEVACGVQVPDHGIVLGPDTPPGVKYSEEREASNSGAEFQMEEPTA